MNELLSTRPPEEGERKPADEKYGHHGHQQLARPEMINLFHECK